MKKWMKKMAIIGAVLFVGGIGVTSIGAAIGGAAAGLDFLIDQEKNFQDKYNWGDSEEIWDDTEQLPEELDESDGKRAAERRKTIRIDFQKTDIL